MPFGDPGGGSHAVHRDGLVGLVREEFERGGENALALGGLLVVNVKGATVVNFSVICVYSVHILTSQSHI